MKLFRIHIFIAVLFVALLFGGVSSGYAESEKPETAQQTDSLKPLSEDLTPSPPYLEVIESIPKEDFLGELIIFYEIDKYELKYAGSDIYNRLEQFASQIVEKSQGKKILLVYIGSASAIGPKDNNVFLGNKRANAPVPVLEKALADVPHENIKMLGTADFHSPRNVSMPTHYQYQHTRVIAYYHKPAIEILKPVALPKTITNSIGMTFVYIEPVTFLRGSPEDENGRFDSERQHEVTLTHGYYLQTTEATQGQWKKIMGNNPAYFQNCGDDCPVEQVSELDVQNFIKKLVLEENENKYRLPTEAEWEYACRAGTQTAFYSRDMKTRKMKKKSKMDEIGWYWGNSSQATHGVALKEPNAWGLYDMHGNVWEWCSDKERPYPFRPVINPTGSTIGRLKIRRGGSFSQFPRFCRSAYRSSWLLDDNAQDLGFRLVLEPAVVLNKSDWKMAN